MTVLTTEMFYYYVNIYLSAETELRLCGANELLFSYTLDIHCIFIQRGSSEFPYFSLSSSHRYFEVLSVALTHSRGPTVPHTHTHTCMYV